MHGKLSLDLTELILKPRILSGHHCGRGLDRPVDLQRPNPGAIDPISHFGAEGIRKEAGGGQLWALVISPGDSAPPM